MSKFLSVSCLYPKLRFDYCWYTQYEHISHYEISKVGRFVSIVRCIQNWIYHPILSKYSCDTLWYSIPSTVPPLILVFFFLATSLAGSSQRVVYDCYHVTVTGCKWGIDWCRGMKLNETTYLCPPFNMCFPWSLIFCRWDSPITRNSGNGLQSWHLP